MERLIEKSVKKVETVKQIKVRFLYDEIDWGQRLIIILGYRGTGKTTLLLQRMSAIETKSIYLSLDDIYFETNRLVNTVEQLYNLGYRLFLLDEVHKNLFWAKDIKQLYDDYNDLQIVATGSSILDISKGNADLSRRASVYNLPGLSFREYLLFSKNIILPKLNLAEIIQSHHSLAEDLLEMFVYKSDFKEFLLLGHFPFFIEAKQTYFQKLEETINTVMDSDIAPYAEFNHSTMRLMRKLLFVLSESVPFTPNINKLAEKLDSQRNTILKLLDYMHQAQLIHLLKTSASGTSYLQKPEKIYLQNTNFIHLFSPLQPNIGNIRETFFINQVSAVHTVTSPKYGDFFVADKYVFEIGGINKTNEQIRGVPEAYLALEIESGVNNRIPLWMFGLLY